MQRITITIPRHSNNRLPLSDKVIDRIEGQLLGLCGGYSRVKVHGHGTDDSGTVSTDESYRYEILTEYPSDYKKLFVYANQLCSILDQKCILTTCENVQVDFVTG